MSLYLSLSIYILSLLCALVLVITGKNQREGWIKSAVALHLLFLLLFLVYLLKKHSLPAGSPFRFAFLAALCSGLVTGGFVLRSEKHSALKIYCALYFLSLLFFLVSPSRFASFLSRGDLEDASPKRFHVTRNFFLEEQHAPVQAPGSHPAYKLVQEFGLFHRTIRRDIPFESEPDSLQVLQEEPDHNMRVRVYFHRTDTSSAVPYPREIILSLVPDNTDPIHRIHY